MQKTTIIIGLLIITGISLVLLFYPDFIDNQNEVVFIAEVELKLYSNDGKSIDEIPEAIINETLDFTVTEMDDYFVSSVLAYIGYDTKVNRQEAKKSIDIQKTKNSIKIIVQSHNEEFAYKMVEEITTRFEERKYKWGQPFFFYEKIDNPKVRRELTAAAILDREYGEKILVSIFCCIWISCLWVIIKREKER